MSTISSWGGYGSNCYIDITGANSVLTTTVIDPSAWTSATSAQQSAALQQAAKDIDSLQYIGTRYYGESQTLEFPRAYPSRFPFNYTRSATISTDDYEQAHQKAKVEQACSLQALHLLRLGGRNQDLERQRAGISGWSETIGPLSVNVQYGGSSSTGKSLDAKLSPEVLALLADYRTTKHIYRA